MHGGWGKELFTLSKIFSHLIDPNEYSDSNEHENIQREKDILLFENDDDYNLFRYKNLQFSLRYHKSIDPDPILVKFTEKELNSFFGPHISLEKYVNHYVRLSEYCGEDYQAVGDFSNPNFLLSKNELNEVRLALSEYFDVKVLLSVRDPIRRHWSRTCAFSSGRRFPPRFGLNTEISDNFWKGKKLFNKYPQVINNAYDVFGKENVCYLVMEEFFDNRENNSEVSKLEQFLGVNIPEVYPCVFVPDRGINPPQIEGLADQWMSDTEILTPEFYNSARNSLFFDQIYSEFEELHGSLPADWGRPIDYDY
jgi:hypothetical protein